MSDPQVRPAEPMFPADLTESPVPFRFSLAWSSVFVLLEPAKSPQILTPLGSRSREVAAAVAEPPRAAELQKPALGSKVNWEMVVPKMNRPAPRPEPATLKAPPPVSAPNFYTASEPVLSRRSGPLSFGIKLVLGTAVVTAILVAFWLRTGTPRQPEMIEVTSAMGEGGWMRERVAVDAGLKQGRQLVLYRPSLSAADCRLEFTWRVDERGIGWVFRAKDTANYYAARLKVLRPGPAPTLSVEHFTVYQGVESAHEEKALSFSRNAPVLMVRMDAIGPSFTLYLQGSAADYWTDTRMKTGGVGFFEERNHPADAQALRISFSTPASGGA